MTTANDIVESALEYLQYAGEEEPITDSDMSKAIKRLNRMMAAWTSDGIRLGYRPVDSSGDYITAPDFAEEAIEQNLAVQLAPAFRVPASRLADVGPLAGMSYRKLQNRVITIPETQLPDTLPRGSGNDGVYDFRETFYPGTDLAVALFEFSGNTTAESLTANTPATIDGPTWTAKNASGFTATAQGTAQYIWDGIAEISIGAQLLVRGSGSNYPGTITIYPARNKEYIKSAGIEVSLDDTTEASERLVEIDFGQIGVTKNDVVRLMIESTADAALVVNGYMEVKQWA